MTIGRVFFILPGLTIYLAVLFLPTAQNNWAISFPGW